MNKQCQRKYAYTIDNFGNIEKRMVEIDTETPSKILYEVILILNVTHDLNMSFCKVHYAPQ